MLTHTHAVYTYILLFSQLAHTRKRTHLIELHMSECTENTCFVTLTPKHKLLDFFFFSTNESKIHSHFHFLEGEMALLNTAWFGDLSLPPFPLLVSLTNTSLHTSVSLSHCHSLVLTLFLPASVQFPLSLGTVYSLFTSSHPVFKLRLGVCVCETETECVSLLLAHFLNKGHSCCRFAE